MTNPHYCLFFSFKGGVGRTSALMNVALFLAKRKKRVLVIDFDLHAPGVDIFDVTDKDLRLRLPSYHATKCYHGLQELQRNAARRDFDIGERLDEFDPRDMAHCAPMGFLELALHWQNEVRKKEKDKDHEPMLPNFSYPDEINGSNAPDKSQFVYRLPSRALGEGDILIMRAANHDDPEGFRRKLLDFDVATLEWVPEREVEPERKAASAAVGQPDTENLPFVEKFKQAIHTSMAPDYVLIDGRPGFDGISVFAMQWLADSIVLASNLNPWNIKGVIKAYDYIVKMPRHVQHPNLLLVLSPIPNYAKTSNLYAGQFEAIKTRMERLRNNGSGSEGDPIEIPYSDILSLRDVLITDIQSTDPAVQRYENLGRLIISGNQPDLENRIQSAKSAGDPDQVITAFERLFREYARNEALPFEYGVYLLSIGREAEAEKQLRDAWAMVVDQDADRNVAWTSAYKQDTAFQYSRALIAGVRRTLSRARLLAFGPDVHDQIITALKTLKKSRDRIDEAVETSKMYTTKAGHPPLHALLGELWYLQSDCQSVLTSITNRMKSAAAPGSGATDAIPETREQCLEKSISEYEKAVSLATKVPRYRHELGLARSRFATLARSAAGSNAVQRYEEAITAFNEELLLRSDSADGLLQKGRFLLATAVVTGGGVSQKPLPLFHPEFPYFESAERPREWLHSGPPSIDQSKLKDMAQSNLSKAIRHRSHEFFAYFNRGIVQAMLGLDMHNNPPGNLPADALAESVRSRLSDSIVDFNTASLYQPHFSPSYLLSGMIQFLLEELESTYKSSELERMSPALPDIRYRQAFYRLEHFIDQELERILATLVDSEIPELQDELLAILKVKQNADSTGRANPTEIEKQLTSIVSEIEHIRTGKSLNRAPFYFDPDDIAQILERPFAFMFTLEECLQWPPMVQLIRPDSEQSRYKKEIRFLAMIARHLRSDKSEVETGK